MSTPSRRRRLHVVTLIDRLYRFGGAERLAMEIALRLDPTGFDRTLCTTRSGGDPALAADLEAAGVRVLALERRTKLDPSAWATFVRFLRTAGVDVVHSHSFGSNVWGSLWGRIAGVPAIVAHEHTWSYEGEPVRRFLDRELVGRLADVFVAVSQEDRRRMIEIEGVSPEVVRVVPNGIAPLPDPSGRDLRAELGIPRDAPVVGCVSVLRPQKAIEVLLRAAAIVRERSPACRFVIAGEGPDESRLRDFAAELGLAGTVTFLGTRSDVADLLSLFDVAVNSSDYEGSPLAVIEYMAAGKAIVATRVGGVPDLIVDGEHGVLVDRRSPAALAGAIAALLDDDDRRHAFGERARARQRVEFSIETQVERFATLYETLAVVNRGRRPRASRRRRDRRRS